MKIKQGPCSGFRCLIGPYGNSSSSAPLGSSSVTSSMAFARSMCIIGSSSAMGGILPLYKVLCT
nr:hypothetical protein Iba_chr15eCG7460 [Ipomoea batatas]